MKKIMQGISVLIVLFAVLTVPVVADSPPPIICQATLASAADAKIQAAFAEDKIQSLSSQTEIFVGQGFDKCEIPTLSQMQNWITNSPYGAVNLYIGGSCRSCPNSALTASYVSQLSQQGWKFIPTWVGPQSACWGGSCGSRISNDPATAYNQGISEANAAIDVAIDLGLALADGSGTIIYYDLENYDTTNTACRNAAKSFISGWTAQLHARGSEAGVYGSSCGSEISDFASISNVPDAIWPAHWIYSSYNSGATVWDVKCLSNSLWANHQRIRQYAGGHGETWGGVTLNIDCNVIDGIVASVGPTDIIPLTGDMYGNGKDITGFYNANTAEFTFGGEAVRYSLMADKLVMSESGVDINDTHYAAKAGFHFDGKTDDIVNNKFTDQGAELGVLSSSSSYDRQAAYNYAQKYCDEVCSDGYFWNTRTGYISLSLGTNIVGWTGYDCAHFVSCCIGRESHEQGGGLDVPSRTATYGEPSAQNLGDWLIDNGIAEQKTSINQLEKGDVINYDWTGDGHWDHAALYLGSGKVAAHTTCVCDEPWQLGTTHHRLIHIKTAESIPIPLTGDMHGAGTDTTGTYNTGTAEFKFGGKTVRFGQTNDEPIIGDWDGDGFDEIGVFRPSASMFYLVLTEK